jgi:hypothetical protein
VQGAKVINVLKVMNEFRVSGTIERISRSGMIERAKR